MSAVIRNGSINTREAHNALAVRMLADTLPNWKVPQYHRELPHSNQMLISMRNQIMALMPDTVVLCSEVMSHFGYLIHKQAAQNTERIFQDIPLACRVV